MKIKRVIGIISIICMSTNYTAQALDYAKELQSIVSQYSGTQKDRSVFQKGAQEIRTLFQEAQGVEYSQEFTQSFLDIMNNSRNDLLPLKIEINYQMSKNKDKGAEKLLPQLQQSIVSDIKPPLTVERLLEIYTIFPPANVNYLLLKAFPTTSGNALVDSTEVPGAKKRGIISQDFQSISKYIEENQNKLSTNQTLMLEDYVRDYYRTQITKLNKKNDAIESKLQKLYDQAVNDGNRKYIQAVLIDLCKSELQSQGGRPGPIMDFSVELASSLNSNDDKEFKKQITNLNNSRSKLEYIYAIGDVLKESVNNKQSPQEVLQKLYDDAKEIGTKAIFQNALIEVCNAELKSNRRVPGPIMEFSSKLASSLKEEDDQEFKFQMAGLQENALPLKYTQEITDLIKDKENTKDLQAKLQKLYENADKKEKFQKALITLYNQELEGTEPIPGPIMQFCNTLLPSLKKNEKAIEDDEIFEQQLLDAQQKILQKDFHNQKQKLIDMFNVLQQTNNEEIIEKAQAQGSYLLAELLVKAYNTFSPTDVNNWILQDSSLNTIIENSVKNSSHGKDLIIQNIEGYLAATNDSWSGGDRRSKNKNDKKNSNLLNDFVNEYNLYKDKVRSQLNPTNSLDSLSNPEVVEQYKSKITDILTDKTGDELVAALKELYDQSLKDNKVNIQQAFADLYKNELQSENPIPGSIMKFCTTVVKEDEQFQQKIATAWQTALDSTKLVNKTDLQGNYIIGEDGKPVIEQKINKPDDQKLIDMFNFLSQPGNEIIVAKAAIISKAQVVPNLYVDAVIQGVRTIQALKSQNPNDPIISTQLDRLQKILGGSSKSSLFSDFLQNIAPTEEDGERDSKDQSDSDLFNTSPRVWTVLASNLLDAAAQSDKINESNQLEKVEKVLQKSRKKGKFTFLKNKVSRWFSEYCTLRNLQLKWKTSTSTSDENRYQVAIDEIKINTDENEIIKVDPRALCVSVSVILKTLNGESTPNGQPDALLTQLKKINGVTIDIIHDVIIDQLPKNLRQKFIKALGNNQQSALDGLSLTLDNTPVDDNPDPVIKPVDTTKPVPSDPTSPSDPLNPVDRSSSTDNGGANPTGMSPEEHQRLLEEEARRKAAEARAQQEAEAKAEADRKLAQDRAGEARRVA